MAVITPSLTQLEVLAGVPAGTEVAHAHWYNSAPSYLEARKFNAWYGTATEAMLRLQSYRAEHPAK